MSCRAGKACPSRAFMASVFLGRPGKPPQSHFVGLFNETRKEVVGPSYRRQRISFRKAHETGRYENESKIAFRATHVDDEWNVAYATLLNSEEPGTDCTCHAWPMKKARNFSAGDTVSWEPGDFSIRYAGHRSGLSSFMNEMATDFLFGGIEPVAPKQFYMGIFQAGPKNDSYVELMAEGYERKRMYLTHGKDTLSAFNSDDLLWKATGQWNCDGFGVWAGPDAFALDQPLLLFRAAPFGGRDLEAGDVVGYQAGNFKIG